MDTGGYRWEGADLILHTRIQPRASRDQWAESREGRFRVRITAPPVDGQANAHLREFLAALFGVAKSQVALLTGETGRDKRLRIVMPKRLPPGIEPPAAA
ncbi:MAG: YggU family protein [Candidatus Competibacteraceae bacterium]|nr:YggU family protein [Candidatus Competibacteraceae bacterium]MBK8750586.1 YggU family protein [Candidatus Competibacteraceae bacterium]